jgi:hypothetical protein
MEQRCNNSGDVWECIRKVHFTIEDCLMIHKSCLASEDMSLPRRVLDVGAPNRNPRVIECHGMSGKYIALSHSWGGIAPLITTKANLMQIKQGLPFESFPKTFRETMLVAPELGTQYVWIDCLCLVQDDLMEWQTDSVKMADIYGNSYLTIAATLAQNAHDGLFFNSAHDGAGPFEIDPTLVQKLDNDCRIFVTEVPAEGQSASYYSTRSKRQEHGLALHSRAWAHQEFFLAPRVLQFGHELQWDYAQTSCCCSDFERYGRYPVRVPDINKAKFKKIMALSTRQEAQETDKGLGSIQAELSAQWRREAEVFSGKDITHASGRLPALSGLAKRFLFSGLSAPYLAGTWLANAHRELCWRASVPAPAVSSYIAPSFSWTSISAPIEFFASSQDYGFQNAPSSVADIIGEVLFTVLDAACHPAYGDQFGAVTGGFIRLSSQLLHGQHIEADLKLAKTAYRLLGRSGCGITLGKHVYPVTLDFANTRFLAHEDLHCLLMSRNDELEHYMVLREIDSLQRVYSRIGWLSAIIQHEGVTHETSAVNSAEFKSVTIV